MTNSATLGSFGDASNAPLVFRNKIINGNFDIWQRGTSQTSAGYASDDRWNNSHAGSSKTASQQTFTIGQTDVPNNPRYWARTVVTSSAGASNYVLKQQPVENVATLSGQTATLSFWAKADASKNMAVEFVQNFGTGGSPSTAITGIGVTTCALTTSWKYFTVTVSIPSISGKTLGTANNDYLGLNFWFDAGSTFNARTNSLGQQSGTFDIAQVQLEAGLSATPFEQRPIGMELALCQRYYYKQTYGNTIAICNATWSSVSQSFGVVVLPVTMRSTPSSPPDFSNLFMWHPTGTNGTVSSVSVSGSGTSIFLNFTLTGSSAITAGYSGYISGSNSSSYIAYSAEL